MQQMKTALSKLQWQKCSSHAPTQKRVQFLSWCWKITFVKRFYLQADKLALLVIFIISRRFAHLFKWASSEQSFLTTLHLLLHVGRANSELFFRTCSANKLLYAILTDVIKWHWRPPASKMSNSRFYQNKDILSVYRILLLQQKPKLGRTKLSTGPHAGRG